MCIVHELSLKRLSVDRVPGQIYSGDLSGVVDVFKGVRIEHDKRCGLTGGDQSELIESSMLCT